jgi:hypothetical protein
MRKIVLFVALFISVTAAKAQSETPSLVHELNFDPNGPMANEGTFQFIITEPKFQPVFTTDILYFIEQNRDELNDKVIELPYYVTLYIPSRKKISSKDFQLLETFQK